MRTDLVVLLVAAQLGCACSSAVPYDGSDADAPAGRCALEVGAPTLLDLGDRYVPVGSWRYPGPSLPVDGTTLVLGANAGPADHDPGRWVILLYDLSTGSVSEATSGEHGSAILDAADGQALVAGLTMRLVDLATGEATALEGDLGTLRPFELDLVRRPRRMVEGRQAAWTDDEGVYWFDGGETRLIDATAGRVLPFPFLDGDHVYYMAFDDVSGQVIRYGARGVELLHEGASGGASLYARDGRAIWGAPSGVTIFEGGTARSTTVPVDSERGCRDCFLSGSTAAFVCDGNRLYRHDLDTGATTLVAAGEEGAMLGGPRLSRDGVLAWAELAEPCGGGGAIYVEHDGRVTAVAEILTDDYCVGHLPIPIALQLTDTHVLWADMGGIGFATVRCIDQ